MEILLRLRLIRIMGDKKSFEDRAYAAIGAVIPSCAVALDLVEKGKERPLKLHERLRLFYNSPLCLHCNCNRDKFDKERARMKEIEKAR